MRHMKQVSRIPALAQTSGVCDDITNASQAKFCFTISFLQGFLLPIIQLKEGYGPTQNSDSSD